MVREKFKNFKIVNWIVVLVIVLGAGLRLKNFSVPPVDGHQMRQTDTECVAYFLYSGKANFFRPKSCLMRPVSNTKGYFFLEMPFYESLIAISYKIFGPEIWAARLVNLLLYIIGAVALWKFLGGWIDKKVGLWGLIIYSLMPGSIFFVGHAIHPDAMAVSLIWVSLYLIYKFSQNNNFKFLIGAGVAMGISVASRPFGLIALPLLVYFLWERKSKWWNYLVLIFLSIVFYGWWRWWTHFLNLDMSWENWVLHGREKLFDLGILKNLIWKNVVGEVMGKTASALAVLGWLVGFLKKNRKMLPLGWWTLGVVVYWLMVPNGNLTHQYYADVYIPLVVILAAIGWNFIFEKSKILGILVLPILVWNGVRVSNYFLVPYIEAQKDIEIAQEIKQEIGEDKKIIYLNRVNSVPLSLSHRQGWILGEWPTDVAGHIWAFMEMRNFKFDYIVEPKHKVDLKTEDWEIIKQNYPLVKFGEKINIFERR
ncbi:MAG TPA: glycosyltransferase family 39 protein [Candidatus Woesebacteria bacterium]|nr:glycosyltransferase family 39 protein [Candidatus Woesebacteria bacterium]